MGKFKTLVRNALPVFVSEDSLSQVGSVFLKGNVVCLFDALFQEVKECVYSCPLG